MSLGERIYRLRTEKKLSQSELADALEVSRQSISKWETDASVPELDKLVKLSELFGVSLDVLVLDKKQPEAPKVPEPQVIYAEREKTMPVKKVVGILLLCFAALLWLMITLFGDLVAGLVLAAPVVACGLVCLLVRERVGLWCSWIVYLFIEIYLRFATGVTWQFIFWPQVYSGGWTIQLIVAWLLLAVFLVLTLVTAVRLKKAIPGSLRGDVIGTAVSWAVYIVTWFLLAPAAGNAGAELAYSQAYRYVSSVSGWVRNIVFAVALVFTVRLIGSLWSQCKRKKRSVM